MKIFRFLIILFFLSVNAFAQTSTGWRTIYESNIGKIDIMVTINDPNAKKHMWHSGVYFRTNIPYSVQIEVNCKEIIAGFDNGKPRFNDYLQGTFFTKASNWRESGVLTSDVRSFKGLYVKYLEIENQVLFRDGQEISQFYYNTNSSNNSSSTNQNNSTNNSNFKNFTDLVNEHNRVCQELMNTANSVGKNSNLLVKYCQQGGTVNDNESNRIRIKNEINEMNNEIHSLKYTNNSGSTGTSSMNRNGNESTGWNGNNGGNSSEGTGWNGNNDQQRQQEELARKQEEEQRKIENYIEISRTTVNLIDQLLKERKANKEIRERERSEKHKEEFYNLINDDIKKADNGNIDAMMDLVDLYCDNRSYKYKEDKYINTKYYFLYNKIGDKVEIPNLIDFMDFEKAQIYLLNRFNGDNGKINTKRENESLKEYGNNKIINEENTKKMLFLFAINNQKSLFLSVIKNSLEKYESFNDEFIQNLRYIYSYIVLFDNEYSYKFSDSEKINSIRELEKLEKLEKNNFVSNNSRSILLYFKIINNEDLNKNLLLLKNMAEEKQNTLSRYLLFEIYYKGTKQIKKDNNEALKFLTLNLPIIFFNIHCNSEYCKNNYVYDVFSIKSNIQLYLYSSPELLLYKNLYNIYLNGMTLDVPFKFSINDTYPFKDKLFNFNNERTIINQDKLKANLMKNVLIYFSPILKNSELINLVENK